MTSPWTGPKFIGRRSGGQAPKRGGKVAGLMRFSRSSDEYGAIAPLYDPLMSGLIRPVRREVRRLAAGFRNILDVCCGTGDQCRLLHRAGLRVTGIDLSPAMLRVAGAKGPPEIPYIRGDAARLPFADHTFDCVTFSLALHEKDIPTRARIMDEAKRVLVPGGALLIVDFAAPTDAGSRLGRRLVRAVEWLAGEEHYRNCEAYMARGALEGLLRESGLEARRIIRRHLGTVAIVLARVPEQERF